MPKTSSTLKLIEQEKLKLLFSSLPGGAILNFAAAIFMALSLYNTKNQHYLFTWLSLLLCLTCTKFFLAWLYQRQKPQKRFYSFGWHLSIILLCIASGACWGITAFYFYLNGNIDTQVYILAFTLGIAFLSFMTLMHHQIGFYVFFTCNVLPLVLAIFMTEKTQLPLAFLLTGFWLVTLFFSGRFFQQNDNKIALKYSLHQKNRKVRQINESKSQFLAAASHDLRQPLQALGFYIVLLSDHLREANKKALFDKTLGAYRALESLLNELLNVSKLNAKLVNIQESHFSLADIFQKFNDEYTLQARDKGLSIKFSAADYYICSDEVSVERILRNLIENALRYTEKGIIEVNAKPVGLKIHIEVIDTGIGISEDNIEKIFDEFYQVENPERNRNKGFGLGLYAVNKMAKLLDTKIQVQSIVAQGSIFSILLPQGYNQYSKENTEKNMLSVEQSLENKVILLVDDDPIVLNSLGALVKSWSADVIVERNYKAALSIIEKEQIIPDLLITDYRLPEHCTGIQLANDIQAKAQKKIPVIILTGDTGKESLQAIESSQHQLLHKPANTEQLKLLMLKLLKL